jgi:hypothetical protein
MSIEALSIVLNHSKAMGSPKVVLLGIANHLGPDATDGAYPSQKRLAQYSNLSERGVQKCIEKLVNLGELRVEVAGGHSRNQYKPNRYWLTLECPEDCDKSMSHRIGAMSQGRTTVPSGANAGTVRGEPEFVQTLSQPLENRNVFKTAKAIPDGFEPSDEIRNSFAEKFAGLDYKETIEAFVDHHVAKGSTFKDWDAAFRTWCRNAKKWARPATGSVSQFTRPAAEIPAARAWVRKMHDMGEHWECREGEFGCK